jgi:hypothetical protein
VRHLVTGQLQTRLLPSRRRRQLGCLDSQRRRQRSAPADPPDLDAAARQRRRRPRPLVARRQRLSYSSGAGDARDLFIINADGTHARRILRWRGGDSPNAWLPSGQIVFAHWPSEQARRADWYSIRPDGTRLQALPWLRGAGDPLDWLPAR